MPGFQIMHRRVLKAGSDIDQRFTQPPPAEALSRFPLWDGVPPDDVPIVLETEQGIGDAIQFARFATHLARQGYRVQVLTLPILAPLLRTLPGIETVVADLDAVEGLDPKSWLPLMSIPHRLQVAPGHIPGDVPYLAADPARIVKWKERLGSEGFRVGIARQGNSQNWLDAGRSIPLAGFGAIADIPGVRLISLQKSPGTEQIGQVSFGDRVECIMDESDKSADALLDTAAVMPTLDLVVTSDSMLAHLAGALGCRTFVALRRVPDWRWLLDRDDSPFYPTARLFRQHVEGDWTAVFTRIADAIRQLVANATRS